MVTRGLLATLGAAAVAAAAQGHAAHASLQANFRGIEYPQTRSQQKLNAVEDLTSPTLDQCSGVLRDFRHKVISDQLADFTEGTKDKLVKFLEETPECAHVAEGKFKRKASDDSNGEIFVFAIPEATTTSLSSDCTKVADLVRQAGVDLLGKKDPLPEYKEYEIGQEDNVYNKAAASALAAILHNEDNLELYCGRPGTACEAEKANTLLCYIKGGKIADGPVVSGEVWGKVLREGDDKDSLPEFAVDGSEEAFIEAINDFRGKYGQKKRLVAPETAPDGFNTITCAELEGDTLHKFSETHTFFYALGSDGTKVETTKLTEKWKAALKALEGQPPARTEGGDEYKDNATRAAVSLLSEGGEDIYCKIFTKCDLNGSSKDKEALLCALKGPVFPVGQSPVTKEVWEKVEQEEGIVPKFEDFRAGDVEGFFEETNKFRIKAQLDPLKQVGRKSQSQEVTEAKEVSCYALSSKSVVSLKGNSEVSLMYYVSEPSTKKVAGVAADGVAAFNQWKEGFKPLEDLEALPKYESNSPYDDAEVHNFVSMASPTATIKNCYKTKGCIREGVVCEVTPAVFKESVVPIPQDKWTQIKKVLKPGSGEDEGTNGGDENNGGSGDGSSGGSGDGSSGSAASSISVGSVALVAALAASAQIL